MARVLRCDLSSGSLTAAQASSDYMRQRLCAFKAAIAIITAVQKRLSMYGSELEAVSDQPTSMDPKAPIPSAAQPLSQRCVAAKPLSMSRAHLFTVGVGLSVVLKVEYASA